MGFIYVVQVFSLELSSLYTSGVAGNCCAQPRPIISQIAFSFKIAKIQPSDYLTAVRFLKYHLPSKLDDQTLLPHATSMYICMYRL